MSETTRRVQDWGDLAKMPEGGILSRIVLKNAAGSVTLFALAAGEEISEHTAPFDALVVGLDGSAIITLDDNGYPLQSGQYILMPANVPHSVRATSPCRFLLVMLKA